MKALSLIQPWATLIAIGAKTIETRSWGTDYRGPIAIHASKWLNDQGRIISAEVAAYLNAALDEPFVSALAQGGIGHLRDLPSGAIVAPARLVGVRRTEDIVAGRLRTGVRQLRAWPLRLVPGRRAAAVAGSLSRRAWPVGLWDLPDAVLWVQTSAQGETR